MRHAVCSLQSLGHPTGRGALPPPTARCGVVRVDCDGGGASVGAFPGCAEAALPTHSVTAMATPSQHPSRELAAAFATPSHSNRTRAPRAPDPARADDPDDAFAVRKKDRKQPTAPHLTDGVYWGARPMPRRTSGDAPTDGTATARAACAPPESAPWIVQLAELADTAGPPRQITPALGPARTAAETTVYPLALDDAFVVELAALLDDVRPAHALPSQRGQEHGGGRTFRVLNAGASGPALLRECVLLNQIRALVERTPLLAGLITARRALVKVEVIHGGAAAQLDAAHVDARLREVRCWAEAGVADATVCPVSVLISLHPDGEIHLLVEDEHTSSTPRQSRALAFDAARCLHRGADYSAAFPASSAFALAEYRRALLMFIEPISMDRQDAAWAHPASAHVPPAKLRYWDLAAFFAVQ